MNTLLQKPLTSLGLTLVLLLLAPGTLLAQSDLDLVFGNQTHESRLCSNDGLNPAGFTCTAVGPVNHIRGIAAGDFDGDGLLDVVQANNNGRNQKCLNDGLGSFTCSDVSTGTGNTQDVAVADIDGDTDLDLVFSTFTTSTNEVCLNDGSGNFSCSAVDSGVTLAWSTAVDDIDGDSDLDLIFGREGRNRMCLNDGLNPPSFTCSNISNDTNTSRGTVIGDLDGDSDLDLAFANGAFGKNRFCLNDGLNPPSFSCFDVEGFDKNTWDVGTGDIDGDSDLDLIFATENDILGRPNRVCVNDGLNPPSFSCSNMTVATPISFGVAMADIDGDTDLDAIFANVGGNGTGAANEVCVNDGSGSFTCSNVSVGFARSWDVVVGNFDAPSNGIAPVPAASLYWPNDVATVNIDLDGVTDILGVGGKLAYDATRLTYDDPSLAAGAFLDDGSTILFEDDDAAGTASFSVTRTSGSGATGNGTAATVTLTVDDESPPGTANFSLSDLLAVSPTGSQITLNPTDGSFEVGGVWPGDTDNNCTAEAADLLPIGLNFGDTGPARPGGFDITWSAKAFSPWGGSSASPDFSDSFVDATGDGEIDQNDVLPIGVNFGETHAATSGCTPAALPKHLAALNLSLDPQPVGTVITVHLDLVEQTDGLVGTALKLAVDPSVLKVNSVTAGDFLDDGDLLKLVQLNNETGLSEAAFTRKGTDRAISGTGALAVLALEVIGAMASTSELSLSEVKLSTAAAGIFEASEQALSLRSDLTTATASEDEAEVPSTFTLHGAYPNPFNPATTVSFDLPQPAQVTLVVFDVLGREVRRVNAGEHTAGSRQTLRFDAAGLASGTYLYRLEAQMASELSVQMGRFVLLK